MVIVCMVRQFLLGDYEYVALCALALIMLLLPSVMQVSFHVRVPQTLEIIMLCFIYASEIMGEINHFYMIIPFWDTILHTLCGFLAAGVGFSLVTLLNRNEKLTFMLSPLFTVIVAFCFSMMIGIIWEFFEFSMDTMFQMDMQKDTIINTIGSVLLDTTGKDRAVVIKNITDTAVNGTSLGINGYLDIGLIDTMKDLFVNFVGALTFSIFGYRYCKSLGKDNARIENFVIKPDNQTV